MGHMDKSLILAIETSGRTGSVAVGTGDTMLAEGALSGHLRHGSELFDCCQRLFRYIGKKAADVNEIYISSGPGSFTGVRIASTMAKVFSLANGAQIVGVSTMDTIFANAITYIGNNHNVPSRIAVMLDAKRGQFYVASYVFSGGTWAKDIADCLITEEEFIGSITPAANETVWLLGEGLVYYRDRFQIEGVRILDEQYWYPRAANVYRLGRARAVQGCFDDPATMLPRYLRQAEAIKKKDLAV